MTSALGQARWRRPFYGWYVVGMAFLCLFIGAGTGGFTFGIFLPAMRADLGWSQSTLVVAASITSITSALAGPILGRIVDLRGPRLVLILSIVGMAVGMFASGLVDQPWQLYVTFGLLSGIARAALQNVLPGTMISAWFIRRRSAAYSVAAMGPPCSNLLMPPILAAVVWSQGWREGWMAFGLIGLAIGLLPALLISSGRPEERGLLPDGDVSEPADSDTSARGAGAAEVSEDWTAREAIHSLGFWMVACAMALVLLAPNVSIIFLFSYLTSKGIDPGAAAAAVASVSATQVISRMVFWAPLSTRVSSVRWMLVLWGSLMLCSTLMLAFAPSEIWAFLASGVLGLGLGGNLILQLQVWPEYFGRVALGTIIGIGSMVQGITAAVIPLALAAMLDQTGSYTALYLTLSGFVFAGLLIHLVVGRPRRTARSVA